MKKLYVNLEDKEYLFSTEAKDSALECLKTEKDGNILLTLHPLCSYLDSSLFKAAQKKWRDKTIRLCYDEDIALNRIVFAAFKGSAFD